VVEQRLLLKSPKFDDIIFDHKDVHEGFPIPQEKASCKTPNPPCPQVVVAVRVRPLTERERASQTRQAVVIQGPKITLYEEAISRANSARAPEQGAEGARARANRPAESALPPGAQEFTFDLVQNDSELKENGVPRAKAELQEALFQALGQQCLNSALEGYNVTVS
jgi:hypothetical protein